MIAYLHKALAHLASRRIIIVAALLAVVLTLPSLGAGWLLDDYFHQLMLTRQDLISGPGRSPTDTFRFMNGNPERTQRLMDVGVVPWWTWPNIRAAFWRPVTVATHSLDYRLWPKSPMLMHAHSLAWYGLLAAAAAVLYRRIMGFHWRLRAEYSTGDGPPGSPPSPLWVAGLAAVLYAIDDAHGMPVGWLANRNAVVATFFGVATIIAHDRWRRDPQKPAGWAAVLAAGLLGLSVLSAEAGIATFGYLFAYAVFLDKASWHRRVVSLTPYVLVVVAWRTAWVLQGYGVDGMGLYTDPLDQPLKFLGAVGRSVPLLILGQWAVPPSDIMIMLTAGGIRGLWAAGVAATAVLAALLAPVIRGSSVGRFWACGMLLSLLPVAATFPSDRLLFFVGLGAMGLLAMFLQSVFETPVARWKLVPAGVLVVIHLLIAPLALPIRSGFPAGPTKTVQALHVRTPLDDSVADQDVIIVNAPIAMQAHYLAIMRPLKGEAAPRRTRVLAPAVPSITVRRTAERSLYVQANYLSFPLDRLFRNAEHPFARGERVELAGMTVQITALADDGRPAEALFTFDVPLEHSSLRWLYYRDREFVPFTPPAVGQTITLDADWPW